MPNLNWNNLTPQQLGRYAEYYAKMEFASYGFEVYTSEVDDHGVDFVIKNKKNRFFEIQVKSLRENNKGNYIFIKKSKMDIQDTNRIVCFIYFINNQFPEVFLIPAYTWKAPNKVFVDRNYDKLGQASQPEWGINFSKKNRQMLLDYKIDRYVGKFKDE